MSLPLVYTGQYAGDGTGDPGKVAFDKINAYLTALAAAIAAAGGTFGLNYASTTIAADTNNFTLGGSFPSGISQVDFLLTTQNCQLTGMQAGAFNGQPMWIGNLSTSTFNLTLPIESTGSTAVNRWNGPTGSIVLAPGFCKQVVYYSTLQRWRII